MLSSGIFSETKKDQIWSLIIEEPPRTRSCLSAISRAARARVIASHTLAGYDGHEAYGGRVRPASRLAGGGGVAERGRGAGAGDVVTDRGIDQHDVEGDLGRRRAGELAVVHRHLLGLQASFIPQNMTFIKVF